MFSTLKATLKASFPKLHAVLLAPSADLPRSYHWWQIPTLLSLDAPVVAYVWQQLVSTTFGAALTWQLELLLISSVWLVYVADRCLDAQRLSLHSASTARHQFYVVHSRTMWLAWAVVFIISLLLSLSLPRPILLLGLSMAGLAALYLGAMHVLHWPLKLPKEVLIASMFSLGVHFAVLVNAPLYLAEVLSLTMFGVLCFLNCALIAFWEQDADKKQGHPSIARAKPTSRRWLEASGVVVIVGSSLSWLFFPQQGSLWGCIIASSVLLGVLEYVHNHLPAPLLRVLVDAVLLTPLVVLVASLVLG